MANAPIIRNNTAAVLASIRKNVAAAVTKTADDMAETMREKVTTGGRSGAMYGTHQASAPGEAPADWHHGMLESIGVRPTGELSAEVHVGGEGAPYVAEFLEFGSDGGKVAPRPLVTLTAEEYRPIVAENIGKAVKAGIEKAAK